jgi:hypothetical protein
LDPDDEHLGAGINASFGGNADNADDDDAGREEEIRQ